MLEKIKDCFTFCNDIIDFEIKSEKKTIDSVLFQGFLTEFNTLYESEKSKLPYHINLLDELHANENAHSRILTKLLQAKSSDYYILKSFLKHLGKPFSELSLNNNDNIRITAEKDRIDLRIRTNNFSIIIENKIHDAIDQDQQIKRYVDIEEDAGLGYSEGKNIFVIYLSNNPGKTPHEKSLPQELLDKLGSRFRPVSYCNTILPWLEEKVMPICLNKETFLTSAITQYIDHLNGMFNNRKFEIQMNEEIKKFIIEKLKLSDKNLEEQLQLITSKEEEIRNILNHISNLKYDMIREKNIIWLNNINIKMKEDFKEYDPTIIDLSNKTYIKSYITFRYLNVPIVKFMIEIDQSQPEKPYFGMYVIEKGKKEKIITDLLSNNSFPGYLIDGGDLWYCSKVSTYENIYDEFSSFVKRVIELLE